MADAVLFGLLLVIGAYSYDKKSANDRKMEFCSYSTYELALHDPLQIQTPDIEQNNRHSNNMKCSLVLKTRADPLVVTFYFNEFGVELSPSCDKDWLCLNGVKFCGEWLPGRSVNFMVPAYSNFTMAFRSNPTTNWRGFKVSITTKSAVGEVVSYPYGGIGSHPTQPFYVTKTFDSKYIDSYKDKCADMV